MAGNGAVSGATNGAHSPFISVDSVWKVFGRNPERVLEPRYAGMDKSFIQGELGNVIGLQDVSFSVEQGETFVIMGLSGSGKSTMVRCLIRLIEPTAGSIVIDGEDITTMSDKDLIEFRPQQNCDGLPALRADAPPQRHRQRFLGPGGAGR